MPSITTPAFNIGFSDDGEGAPVILVHGSASSRHQWGCLARELSPRYRVLAPDLNGYGSTRVQPPSNATATWAELEVLRALLRHAGEPAHLVGHSYGGALCLLLAVEQPQQVRSLSLLEPTAFELLAGTQPAEYRRVTEFASRQRRLVERGELAGAAAEFIGFWFGRQAWVRMPAARQEQVQACMPKVAQEWSLLADSPSLALQDLARVASIPLLLMKGERTLPAAALIVELIAQAHPLSISSSVPAAGHMFPLTHAEAVNSTLARFVAGKDPFVIPTDFP